MNSLIDCSENLTIGPVKKLQFPHCEFSLASISQISDFIAARLGDREPASIIRLGDGEGAVLARPTPSNAALWPTVHAHFGPRTTPGFVDSLANKLTCAIDNADVIGVRDDLLQVDFPKAHFSLGKNEFTQKFRALFNLRPVEKNIDYYGALRLALMHRFLSGHVFRSSVIFGSAWLHFGLSQSGALIRMVREQKRIGLISSKPDLPRNLEKLLNVNVSYYQIPDIYLVAAAKDKRQTADQLPNSLMQTLSSLKVESQGQLFLVGAGVFGKAYCHRIKELGGIAIDIGAVCDAWLGIPSRPLVFQSLYDGSGDVVPEILLLEQQVLNQ